MNRWITSVFVALLIAPVAQAELRAGTSVVDITPVEFPLAPQGSHFPRPVDSVRDPLHVRCLVLDDGSTTIAMAVVDSCMVHRAVLDPAKERAAKITDIPVENMMVCATHTHSAPFSSARNGTSQELAYQKLLGEGITAAIVQAAKSRRPAKAGWGSHDLLDEVFNRRWYLKPGTMPANPFGSKGDQVRMNPGRGAGNLVKPAGPTDPEVSVLYVEDAQGRPLSVFANYSLHYVGHTGAGMSADYFGEFARLMPVRVRRPADGFVAMLSNGTSGDINNINFRNPRPPREPFEQIRMVASKTADAATRAIGVIDKKTGALKLGMLQRELSLKRRAVSDEQVARAREYLVADAEGEKKLPRLAKLYAARTLAMAGEEKTTNVLIQTIRIGDLAICTLPFEVLVEIGLELKDKSPAGDTFTVELANGAGGYLPPPHQHKLGGYETWLGTNKVEKEASVILVKNLLEMLGEMF